MIFVAYELNLPLNIEKPHHRSHRAGEWSLILAHDSRPIYRALTYIAVPLLGPHQPQYIGLTLYITFYVQKHIAPLTMCYNPPLVHNKPLGVPAFVKLSVVIGFNSNSNSGVGVETCAVGSGVDNQGYALVLGVGIQTHGVAVENPRVGVGIGVEIVAIIFLCII